MSHKRPPDVQSGARVSPEDLGFHIAEASGTARAAEGDLPEENALSGAALRTAGSRRRRNRKTRYKARFRKRRTAAPRIMLLCIGAALIGLALFAHAAFASVNMAFQLTEQWGPQMTTWLSVAELSGTVGVVLIINALILLRSRHRARRRSSGRHASRRAANPVFLEIVLGAVAAASIVCLYCGYFLRQPVGLWAMNDFDPQSVPEMVYADKTVAQAPPALWLSGAAGHDASLYVVDSGLRQLSDCVWEPANGFCTHWFWIRRGDQTLATLMRCGDETYVSGGGEVNPANLVAYHAGSQSELTKMALEVMP